MKNNHTMKCPLSFYFTILIIAVFSTNLVGQTAINSGKKIKISGVVTNQDGATIIGANIAIEGAAVGTISDLDGKFNLLAPADAVLKVSYIGYLPTKIAIAGKTNLKIELVENTKNLEEVVVVGYGTIKKSDLTGSVTKLKAENTEEKAYSSIEQMIQGRASGVQITQNSGALGSGMTFSIRGANSASGSNQPLVVIDGYPIEAGTQSVSLGGEGNYTGDTPGQNVLSMLNPNDIESIEILKDASATAIYGSRGANGVVMVTTKRGKEGKDKVEYSFRSDISYLPKKIGVLSTNEYIAYSNEANMDRNIGAFSYSNAAIANLGDVDTNWQDIIYRTGFSQKHQLNLTGGDKKMKYALALGYTGQDGIVHNTRYDQGTLRLNLDREINSRFRFGINISGNVSQNTGVSSSTKQGEIGTSAVGASLRTLPIYNAIDELSGDAVDLGGTTNPYLLVTKADDKTRISQIMLSAFAEYTILSYLKFKVRVGLNNTVSDRNYYMPRGTWLGNTRLGYAYSGNNNNNDYLSEYTLNYSKTIAKKHSINAVGGFTWQQWAAKAVGIGGGGFPNDNFSYYNLSSGTIFDRPQNSTTESALASYLGRINYSYDKRYLLTVTARADGSTRLATGHKWSLFPSVALGWNVHNESFMKWQDAVSELKLRASYGTSGNQSIGVGSTVSRYSYTTGVVNESLSTVYYPANMPNSTLTWENTRQINAGLDLGLFQNRISFGFDYYNKRTQNLLINLPIPGSTGFSIYASNSGTIENNGIEFDLGAKILTRKLKWNLQGNISFNRNKVLEFDGTMQQFQGVAYGAINNQPLHIAKIGSPIGSFYGYKIIGIYQTQDEINTSAVDPANPKPGSFKFADLSGPNGVPDGLISDYDRTIIGNPYPKYIFGINNDFSWKKFSLNIFIQGSIGQQVINGNRFLLDALTLATSNNVSQTAWYNRWTGPGTSNTYPAASTSAVPFQGRFNDFIVEDASYIRLKSATLSYTFEKGKLKLFQSLKVFVTGGNLLTLTKYTGYDPEINSRGSNAMQPGVDLGSIPQFRTYSAGLSIAF
jgi:TonB-linked SusC/RagA family outer membrane protein